MKQKLIPLALLTLICTIITTCNLVYTTNNVFTYH
ncbi:hypothetical protein PMI13_02880 [Chryseobacterium populi]|uniref:Uncharacterized protein n=1 Tax=Chryseobacterium populi TaxID=1144316 RepID=J2JQR9_9FLAO|nr:hypothetical protein PMI13_02880 [Chryseobacterium populi]